MIWTRNIFRRKFKMMLLYIIALFFSIDSNAQNDICTCHRNYYKAEKFYFESNIDSTIHYYQKAFSNPRFHNVSKLFNAADKAVRLGELEYGKSLLYAARRSGTDISRIHDFVKHHSKYEFSIDSSKLSSIIFDSLYIDQFLLSELKFMSDRDQKIRNEYTESYDEAYKKKVDFSNFLILKSIIDRHNDSFPDLNRIGREGHQYISTILYHFEVEWIAEIFPALVEAIKQGYMINDILLYQIERTIIDTGQIYIYDEQTNSIIPGSKTSSILDSKFYRQFYGGYSLQDPLSRNQVWWPQQKDADKNLVNKLREVLCLDLIDDHKSRRPYIQDVSNEKLISILKF